MSNVTKAPLMRVRRCLADESVQQSYSSTEEIPTTLYALREYMRARYLFGTMSDAELSSIKFRHRSPRQIAADKVGVAVVQWWDANWQIIFVKDKDRAQADAIAEAAKTKPRYTYTVYGYCEKLPIA